MQVDCEPCLPAQCVGGEHGGCSSVPLECMSTRNARMWPSLGRGSWQMSFRFGRPSISNSIP